MARKKYLVTAEMKADFEDQYYPYERFETDSYDEAKAVADEFAIYLFSYRHIAETRVKIVTQTA